MRDIQKIICVVSVLLIVFSSKTAPIFANSLVWHQSYQSQSESTSINIEGSTAYASIRTPNSFDILKSVNSGESWISIKNNLSFGSDVNWISIQKNNPQRIAISLWGNGIYLSTNGGTNWSVIYPSAASRSVAIDPSSPDTMYIGIGGNHDQYSGVYKTINGGIAWSKTSQLSNNNAQILIDQNNPSRIFADSDPGFYRSDDNGLTWTTMSLTNAYSNSVIDMSDSNIVYTNQYDINPGVYKTTDSGNNWQIKSNGLSGPTFRLAQDSDGTLYASKVGNGGGIWRSVDGAEHWENVSDPSWGSANTWGLDAKNGRVIVGVEGFGIYYADTTNPGPMVSFSDPVFPDKIKDNLDVTINATDPDGVSRVEFYLDGVKVGESTTSPFEFTYNLSNVSDGIHKIYVIAYDGQGNSTKSDEKEINVQNKPDPIVFIPGFGGSFSKKGLILNLPTTYSDWYLIPLIGNNYYGPLFERLETSGFVKDQSYFFFGYDYRKSITDNAVSLNSFLRNEVIPKNPGHKADIISHSMGGLVVRQCFVKSPGCKENIDSVITAGTPHLGVLYAYPLWEAGEFNDKDIMIRTAKDLVLRTSGIPENNKKNIVQTRVPGIKDLLPIFDYLKGTPYSSMSIIGKNPTLEALMSDTTFPLILTTYTGDQLDTDRNYTITKRSLRDIKLGLWVDGKPNGTQYGKGDNLVLSSSSSLPGSSNRFVNVKHSDYFINSDVLNGISNDLEFPTMKAIRVQNNNLINKLNIFIIIFSKNPNIRLSDSKADSTSEGVLFYNDQKDSELKIEASGNANQKFEVEVLSFSDSKTKYKNISGKTNLLGKSLLKVKISELEDEPRKDDSEEKEDAKDDR